MNNQLMQRGQQWLEELLRLSSLPTSVQVTDGDDSQADKPSYWLTIDETPLTEAQIQSLIGPDGVVIDALQYLANSSLNLGAADYGQAAYTVELNGYRLRRQEELRLLAERAAQQVRQTGQELELKSLSAAERRQVHTFLKECEDLETHSRGQEPDRRLVVCLRS
ncbi:MULTISPECIES: protein jag [unclassified Coleofasciculus]|uniref:Jag family protein n=1 Tax=unclassified Coleofasciculus TaxID=2692782 RepID=UPI0018817F73|nr:MULTISPECIES: R3H domain-containing nucleic acid-binding protein [unclassified Coleofasciculus]MBE9128488.1 RNA-binding protein [Coleofasciculus sp. LEGE 07081]MBE9148692.1 RNA-binding protein [Coleofasciculus sp. LEGE 07092]